MPLGYRFCGVSLFLGYLCDLQVELRANQIKVLIVVKQLHIMLNASGCYHAIGWVADGYAPCSAIAVDIGSQIESVLCHR